MALSPKCVMVTKPGFRQAGISRGLCYILLAVDDVTRTRHPGAPKRVRLTAGSNAHTRGGHAMPRVEALDVGSKEFRDGDAKRHFLWSVMLVLGDNDKLLAGRHNPLVKVWDDDRKIVTHHYFGQLEHEGKRNEHFHIQVRRGHTIR